MSLTCQESWRRAPTASLVLLLALAALTVDMPDQATSAVAKTDRLKIQRVRVLPQGTWLTPRFGFVPVVLVGESGIRVQVIVANRGRRTISGAVVTATHIQPGENSEARVVTRQRTLRPLRAGKRLATKFWGFRNLLLEGPTTFKIAVDVVGAERVEREFRVFFAPEP